EDTAGHLQLTPGRAIDEVIERGACRPKKLRQRFAAWRSRGEDEAAIDADTGHRMKPQLGELAGRIARGERCRLQRAGAVVAPAVVRTDETLDVAAAFGAHHGATMRAAIDQYRYRAIIVTHDDDRLASDARSEVVAGGRNLALVAEHQPRAAEDALELELEDRRIGIEGAMHAVGLHQHRELLVGGHAGLMVNRKPEETSP